MQHIITLHGLEYDHKLLLKIGGQYSPIGASALARRKAKATRSHSKFQLKIIFYF